MNKKLLLKIAEETENADPESFNMDYPTTCSIGIYLDKHKTTNDYGEWIECFIDAVRNKFWKKLGITKDQWKYLFDHENVYKNSQKEQAKRIRDFVNSKKKINKS